MPPKQQVSGWYEFMGPPVGSAFFAFSLVRSLHFWFYEV